MSAKPPLWYRRLLRRRLPRKKLLRNSLVAFVSGGLLCAAAEAAARLLGRLAGLDEKAAAAWVLVGVIAVTALLTGCGVYDKLAQRCGAGLAVPISGFANSVSAAMLEHKSEGLVQGSGCNSFKLAGAVVVFGVVAALAVGVIRLLCGLL